MKLENIPEENPTVLELRMVRLMASAERVESESSWKYYFENKLRIKVAVSNGKPNGKFRLFYEDGEVAVEGFFKDGERWGVTTYYRPDGNVWLDRA